MPYAVVQIRGKLAHPAVIYFVTQLLACYRHVPPAVPRAIVSLLYRIASPDHLGLEPLLYQVGYRCAWISCV